MSLMTFVKVIKLVKSGNLTTSLRMILKLHPLSSRKK